LFSTNAVTAAKQAFAHVEGFASPQARNQWFDGVRALEDLFSKARAKVVR
jgi:hypothetical protein